VSTSSGCAVSTGERVSRGHPPAETTTASDGRVIATGGEGYTTKANALGAVKAVQRDALPTEVVAE
jgi:hypothetical protein